MITNGVFLLADSLIMLVKKNSFSLLYPKIIFLLRPYSLHKFNA